MHEVIEIQRAQELRVDEVSVQKLGENHETIQKHTSQLQEIAFTEFKLTTCKEAGKQSLKSEGRTLLTQVKTD